jgi:RNA-directed DNA polymerase
MRDAETVLAIVRERGQRGLPLEDVYRMLYNPDLYLRAYARLDTNKGAMTKGTTNETVDGMSLAKIAQLIDDVRHERHRWTPVRRVYIAKKKGGQRPLGLPTWKDKLLQEVMRSILEAYYEPQMSQHSHGFRPGRGCHTALHEVQATWTGSRWFVEGDIAKFFDGISHPWLEAHIPMDKSILHKWLKAGYIDKQVFYRTEEGTPQGGPISPALANLTLDGLERELQSLYPGDRQSRKAQVNLIRFADDFVITGSSKEVLEHEVKPLVEQFMKERGLTLSAEKTLITHIEDGFDFLGHQVRKYNGKLIIKPSKKNVKAFLEKVRKVVKEHQGATAGNLILLLNPLIRGWARYHQHVESQENLSRCR